MPEGIASAAAEVRPGAEGRTMAAALERNAAGWGTNVALGFLLGFAPAVGRFFGIPFDVRHVTLSTGTLALSAARLGATGTSAGGFSAASPGSPSCSS